MLRIFDFARGTDLIGITVRLFLAAICGGLIGTEREFKRRSAGFRTHILICLGAAVTTLTSQYLFITMGLYTDVARLGAQVVAGIGFIGAGTIIVTNRQRVKGLTTAAGLWTTAIIGLVCGAGYIECALFATLMVLFAELLLVKLEYGFASKVKNVNLYVEYRDAASIESILKLIRARKGKPGGLEITRSSGNDGEHIYHAVIALQSVSNKNTCSIADEISKLDNIFAVEEL